MPETSLSEPRLTTSILYISGMDCPDCAAKLEKAVSRLPGIVKTSLAFSNGKMIIEYYGDANEVLPRVVDKVNSAGYEAALPQSLHQQTDKIIIRLGGLDCADCAAKLQKAVASIPGAKKVKVNFNTSRMEVNYPGPANDIVKTIQDLGYSAIVMESEREAFPANPFWKTNRSAISTILSGTVLLIAFILKVTGSLPPNFILGIFIFGIVIGAYLPAKSGLLMLINAGEIDMNVLMTIAVIGAIAIGEVEEGAMVVFLFSLGNTLQAFTLDKTRKSIVSLMELTPEQALVRRDNHEFTLPVDQIKVGDLVIIKPGERIPMDGRIVRGTSSVDQSPITGESIPVDKHPGDEVFAGTINQRGAMEIQVAKTAKDNTISRLIAMVEEAQSQRARSQQLVDRFAKYYTPVVIGLAVLVAVVPPVAFNQPLVKWAYQSLAMLLVACPCALVISTPVSIVSAIGNAARNGVLFKGGIYLEEMANLTVMAFDKTGTLTSGRPEVTDIQVYSDLRADELLAITAAIESRSEHPLGTAIIQYAKQKKIDIPVVSGFDSFTGKGATGMVNNELYFVGNPRYIEEHLPVAPEVIGDLQRLQTEGKTVILLADKKEVKGTIAVADTIRPSIIQTLQDLRRVGIKLVVMLTGDNALTAKAIARQLNIDETKADLLPEDKVESVKSLLRTGKVAMIGDGVNDAPALATATVGIAMGAAGTDTALETADVALMADNLSALPYAIRLSKKTVAIIRENIALSIIIKALIMALVIPGMLTMWLAVIGDMGASLLVTLNGLRLLRIK